MNRPNKRYADEDDYEKHKTGSKSNRSTSPQPQRKPEKTNDAKKPRPGTPERKPGIQIKLNNTKTPVTLKPKLTVASVFNQESDSEPEEMPKEARMRMRNIGRDTPTSAGPNSFGKTKHGFCDAKKMFEKHLKDAMNTSNTNN